MKFMRYARQSALRPELFDANTADPDYLVDQYLNWLAQGEPG